MFVTPSDHLTLTSRPSLPLHRRGRSSMNSVTLTTTAGPWEPGSACPALTTPPVSWAIGRKTTTHAANLVWDSQRGVFRRLGLHQSESRRKEELSPQDTQAHRRPSLHTRRPHPLSTGRPTGRRTGGKPATPHRHRRTWVQTPASSPFQSCGPVQVRAPVQTQAPGPPQTRGPG